MSNLTSTMMLLLSLCLGASADAATLNVVGGQLAGASNVDVGGSLYDVEFVEGTCISVFSGCDEAADFTFSDLTTVNVASQALVDQVFLDGIAGNFDTDTTITFGCTSAAVCSAQTPYSLADIDNVNVGVALNAPLEANDGIGDGTNLRTADSGVGIGEFYAFAVWTPVPEPSTGLLMALGLVGLASQRRRVS